jgi:hypothetical protein
MTLQELKLEVAKLMVEKEDKHKEFFGKEGEVEQGERDRYKRFSNSVDKKIAKLIPASEKLSICLTGCAKGDLSHYEIEESLQTIFKAGNGIQYDSEGGQFWVYVKSSLAQRVLRHIDYHFPNQMHIDVSPNLYADNPWFQNWTQARKYLETEVGAVAPAFF